MPLDDELDFVGASSRAQEEVDAGVVVTVDVAVLDSALGAGGGRRGGAAGGGGATSCQRRC